MNTLSNFSQFALTRSEMRAVIGGACRICSSQPNGWGGCGSYSLSQYDANSQAAKLNAKGDGYTYTVNCQ
jgi:natural product precursor